MKKFTSAKQKKEFLEYQKWLDGHRTPTKKSSVKPQPLDYNIGSCSRNTNPNGLNIRSHGVIMDSSATCKKPDIKYTGDKMIGVATLHKSNATPVFSGEEAKNISAMRR